MAALVGIISQRAQPRKKEATVERPLASPTIINALFLPLILITAGLFLIGLVWVALPIFAVMLVLATLSLVLGFHLTPEDAVGLVYWHLRRRDYFRRFVPPRTFT